MHQRIILTCFLSVVLSHPKHYYQYMSHPWARVPISNTKASLYNQPMELSKYMVGELFFKDQDESQYDTKEEELPYTVIQKFHNYEKRFYPRARYICNKTSVDTAADPLAGLERVNPFDVLMSRRYNKIPRSQQFYELFNYIQGDNQEQEKIEMTRPVLTFHNVTKETTLGNYEEQTMCFYLPQKYQEHNHHKDMKKIKPVSLHVPISPPSPNNGRVFLYTRPPMEVFVRTFGGFVLTHNSWETQKDKLEEDILGQKYNPLEYFTVQYNNPLKLGNRRNEIWIKCNQPILTLTTPIEHKDKKSLKAQEDNQ